MMNLIFKLSDDLIDKIFEYHDPYKNEYEHILYDLRWNQYWYHYFCHWFTYKNVDYVEYILKQNGDNNGYYSRVQGK